MAAPALTAVANALLDDATEHYARAVAEQVNGGTTAAANVLAGVERIHYFVIADAASGDSDIVITRKGMVMDIVGWKTGGAGAASNTYTLKNGTTAITDAIDGNVADNVKLVAATRDDAQRSVAAGGTLRLSWAKSGGNVAAEFYVKVLYVA
jgi:hypothetical protein